VEYAILPNMVLSLLFKNSLPLIFSRSLKSDSFCSIFSSWVKGGFIIKISGYFSFALLAEEIPAFQSLKMKKEKSILIYLL